DDIYLSGITDEVQQDATPELSTDCPTDADTNYFLYVVQEGDTLAGIAENFGIDISQMSNCIDESLPRDASLSAGNIQVGDTLYILMSNNQDIQEEDTCQIDESIPTQSYYVQESDTLIGIAVRFEVDIEDIIALNCLNEDGDGAFQFRLNQEILIPDTRQMSIDACTVRLASANSPVFIMSDTRTDSTELYRITNSVLVLDTEVNPDSDNNAEWYYVRATVDRALIEGYVLASLLTSPDDDCVYLSEASTVPGQVRNPAQVVVAARDLAMGTVLEREDLDTISIMPDDIDQPFVFCCVELLIGREVIEPVTTGAFVTENVLGLNPETGTINGQPLPENIVATQDAVVTPTPPVLGVISGMNRVNMRTEPNTTSDIITTLAVGTGIEIIGQNEDGSWLQVRLDDGRTGWVAIGFIRIDESAISNAPAPEIDAFEATATQLVRNATATAEGSVTPTPIAIGEIIGIDGVNLRTDPNTDSDIIATLEEGAEVQIFGDDGSGTWTQVLTNDGDVGWVATGLVRIVEPSFSNDSSGGNPFSLTATQLTLDATGTAEANTTATPTTVCRVFAALETGNHLYAEAGISSMRLESLIQGTTMDVLD
ncbi:MAG: SH3 domain-containing protein, partial [Chloroflexota bacterium]